MESKDIILEPVLTEKTNRMKEDDVRKYVFRVNGRANKIQIMYAVAKEFDVKTSSCNIINVKSKPKKVMNKKSRNTGFTTGWKKAIVTLKKGERIDIFEGV